MLSAACILELSQTSDELVRLSKAGNPNDLARINALRSHSDTLKKTGLGSDEARKMYASELHASLKKSDTTEERYKTAFHKYIMRGDQGLEKSERRDLLSGQQTITATQGVAGGYLIPFDYQKTVFEALAQTDELLSPNVCSFTVEDSPTLQPQQLQGMDLSEIEAVQVSESTQQNSSGFPTVAGRVLRGSIIYKLSIAASIEAEQDIPGVMQKFSRAYGVGFARRLGADAINGNGTSQPQGILTGAGNAVYSTSSGKITNNDIQSIVYSVNRVYRTSPFCGFLMSETVLQRIREAVDNSNRPLINLIHGEEVLAGFPINICPTLGAVGGSLALNSSIVFGDLSHYHIRCSRPTLQRAINLPGYVESGRALYIARIRMDAAVFDPSGGIAPPIIITTVLS